MRALYYIKTTLKSMFSSILVLIANFILFPILMACFMGFMQSSAGSNPLELKQTSISIIDEDNTEMSQKLKDMLSSEELSKFIEIDDEEPDFDLKIEKGYEEEVLSLQEGKITINKNIKNRELTAQTIKVILDNYHKNLYAVISGDGLGDLNTILNSEIIKNTTIDKIETNNTYEKMATLMISYVISYLMIVLIQSSYSDKSISIDNRMISLPITKVQILIYDSIGVFIYSFVVIVTYVMFFRIIDLGFRGSLISLFVLAIISSIFITAIVKAISTIFGGKYGKIVGSIVFMIPIISGEIFGFGIKNITVISPTHYLNNAFNLYNMNGNLQECGKWITIVILISAVIYSAAIVKVCLDGRLKNAINKINFNKYKKTA